MQLGASFSHTHLNSLNLNPLKAIKEFESLGLSWIRLGCYWNEIEKKEGSYDFSKITPLVEYCEKNDIKIVLTIGMKAPRFPEYHLPDWLEDKLNLRKLATINTKNELLLERTLNFLEKSVEQFKNTSSIKIWQVENEPLDPSGPNWWKISPEFLEKEVELVKKLDKREVLINLWGNELSKRKLYKKTADLSDIVGLDLYLRHPVPVLKWFNKYIGPLDSKEKIKNIADEIKTEAKLWITELQAEPWEPGEIVTEKDNPPSFLPEHLESNFDYAGDLSPEVILFWGFEWWYYRKQKGDSKYMAEAEKLIKKFE